MSFLCILFVHGPNIQKVNIFIATVNIHTNMTATVGVYMCSLYFSLAEVELLAGLLSVIQAHIDFITQCWVLVTLHILPTSLHPMFLSLGLKPTQNRQTELSLA